MSIEENPNFNQKRNDNLNTEESIPQKNLNLGDLINGFPSKEREASIDASSKEDLNPLCKIINDEIIGKNHQFDGAFVLYVDYVASGRSLTFIESFILKQVLPKYANTHTTNSATGLQTTLFRSEAKDIVRNAVRALDTDAVIFVGSGCTGAVSKLIHSLSLEKKPVVIVGPFEHHSNLLPWRHVSERWYRISLTHEGSVSLGHLEKILKEEAPICKNENRKMLVCMNAASNITGILTDVDAVCALVHAYDAYIFFDYATAAPYVKIDMNPVWTDRPESTDYPSKKLYKDAIFFSGHKFIGGPQSSGVLIVKKSLLKPSEIHPETPGGGTVFLVTRSEQFYLSDVESREEGGTPAIVEDIRTGLVMKLKQAVGVNSILNRECHYLGKVAVDRLKPLFVFLLMSFECSKQRAQFTKHWLGPLLLPVMFWYLDRLMWRELLSLDSLIVLGHKDLPRLPVCSFVVPFTAWPEGNCSKRKLLVHHNFIAALLNDLFGIQCRAGCACAGPYAMDLLGMNEQLAIEYGQEIMGTKLDPKLDTRQTEGHSQEILRPGFVRFSLPYFLTTEEVHFVLEAVKFVSQHGWVFLPLYKMDCKSGSFVHYRFDPLENRQWLSNIAFVKFTRKKSYPNEPSDNNRFKYYLAEAHRLLNQTRAQIQNGSLDSVDNSVSFGDKFHKLRWFLLPCEAVAVIRGTTFAMAIKRTVVSPFWPRSDGQVCKDSSSVNSEASLVTVASEPLMRYHYSGIFEPHMFPGTEDQFNNSGSPMPKTRTIQLSDKKTDKREVNSKMQRWKASLARHQANGWINPLPELFKMFLSGVKYFDMLKPGDKVLLCLSGGKDSLALLHCLHQYQAVLRREHCKKQGISEIEMKRLAVGDAHFGTFTLGAVTIDPGSSSYDPSPLIGYLRALGVPYFYEQQGIMKQATDLPYQCSSICSFCSRMKRGRIYATARKAGYNVLAMGQHLDDLVESFFMAAFHQGALNTMKANYLIRAQDLRVIRPFVFVREWQTRKFAELANLPIIPDNCPACFTAPKERMRIKRLLAEQETLFPRLYDNMRNTLIPLLHNDRALGLNAQQNAAFAMTKMLKTTPTNRTIHFNLSSDSETEAQ